MKRLFRWLLIAALCVTAYGAVALDAPRPAAAQGAWSVEVYNDTNLTAGPVWTGTTSSVNFNWYTGAPVINGVITTPQTDNFSVRFTTSAFFTAGTYRFTVQVDDGARLVVDGTPVIDAFTPAGLRTLQNDFTFTADGTHSVRVDMLELTADALINVSWVLVSGGGSTTYALCPGGSVSGSFPAPSIGWPPSSGPSAICNDGWNSYSNDASGTCSSHNGVRYWCTGGTPTITGGPPWYADFFNGSDLSGAVIFSTTYPASGLNLNWGQSSPGSIVPADNFSARFLRYLTVPNDLPESVYTFYAYADDGFRFYVDNTLILDRWDTLATERVQADVTLLNGPHTLKLEYREISADAYLFLTWTPPNAQSPVLAPTGGTGSAPPAAPTGITGTVNVNRLNVRAAPEGNIITTIARGQSFPLTGRTGDNAWLRLTVEGQSGWSAARYLTASGDINTLPVIDGQGGAAEPTPPPPTGVTGRVLGNLRVRTGPSTRTAQVGTLLWGTTVNILGRSSDHGWYQVSQNALSGWAYAPWIRITEGSFDQLPYTDGSQPVYAPEPTQGVIAQAYGNMRIRSGPSTTFPEISKAQWGTKVQVLGVSPDGRWLKVQHGDVIGWSYAPWYTIVQGSLASVPVTSQ